MVEVIVFALGEERYGIELTRVREILTYGAPTPLPGTKHFVKGVINIRGEIVPVIDLRLRFGATASPVYTESTPVIAAKTADKRMVAVVVDAIISLEQVEELDLIDIPELATTIHKEFLRGVLTLDGKSVVMIETETMFARSELETY